MTNLVRLVVDKDLKDNVYTVNLSLADERPAFLEAVSDYGNKIINIAGKITKKEITTVEEPVLDENGQPVLDGDGNPTTQTVPKESEVTLVNLGDSFKYFPKDFPIARSFSKVQFGEDTEEIAVAYAELMESRVKSLVDEYKAKPDNFSSTKEVIL